MTLEKWRPMAAESWRPARLLDEMQREMNRFFEEKLPYREGLLPKDWVPLLDMAETKDEVIVRADLPGLKKPDIEVKVVNNMLTVVGERKEEKEWKADDYLRRERFYGTFHRSVELPEGVDANQIKATFLDGVLEVRFPKPPEAKAKIIKIN